MMPLLFRVQCTVLRRKHFKGSTARHWRRFAAGFLFALAGILPALPANASTTAVGTLPGSFGITPSGAATYTIPIALPRGSGGLTPSIALVYSSQSGSGTAGWGWTLSGLSAITRCNKTIDDDGVTQAVQLQSTDDYCLGGERLRVTSGTSGGNATYDTELRGYSLITSYTGSPTGGPSYWTLQTKNGATYEYGNTPDSKIYATNPGGGAQTVVRVWALDRVTDANGNYYTISYQNNDGTMGNYWPVSIQYTGNTREPSSPDHTLQFGWTTRSAGTTQANFVAGTLVTQTELLSSITLDYNNSTARVYNLGYMTDSANGRNLLNSVEECDANGNCFPATAIQWQQGATGWGAVTPAGISLADSNHAASLHLLDVNGDGIADLLYPGASDWMVAYGEAGGGFNAPVTTNIALDNFPWALATDGNGDGCADLMVPGSSTWQLYESDCNEDGQFTAVATGLSDTGTNSVTGLPIYEGNAAMADYSGRGLGDFLYSTGTETDLLPNNGPGASPTFGSAQNLGWSGNFANRVFSAQDQYMGTPMTFDGSGRVGELGFLVTTANSTTVYHWYELASTPAGFQIMGTLGCSNDASAPMPLDATGSGLTDFLFDCSDTGVLTVELTTADLAGGQFVAVPTTVAYDGNDPVFADYDGAGRDEAIVPNGSGWNLIRVNYDAASAKFVAATSSIASPLPATYVQGTLRVGSIEAEGLDGLTFVEDNGGTYSVYYALHAKPSGGIADTVTNITDGLGNSYAPSYASLAGTSAYTEGNGAIYPVQDIKAPFPVVISYNENDGIGGQYTVSYSYANGRQEVTGRGFLGFGSRTITDSRNGVTVSDSYDQNYPFIGSLTSQSITQSNGKALGATANTYASSPSSCGGGALCFPYLSATSVTMDDANSGNLIKTTQIQNTFGDGYGDLTNQTVTTTDNTTGAQFTTTAVTGYADSNASGDYCIDLPTSVTVTKTSPEGTLTRKSSTVPDTSACRPASVTLNPGGTPTLETQYAYDSYGNPATVTVSGTLLTTRATTTDYSTYNGEYPNKITNALNQIATETWDPARGVETAMTDPNGHETQWGYDGFGRKTGETLPTGLTLGWAYDACGASLNGKSLGSPANCAYAVGETSNAQSLPVAATLYDSKGRGIQAEKWLLGGVMSSETTGYDALGHTTAVSKPYLSGATNEYWTHTNYDVLNRPVRITGPAYQSDTTSECDVTSVGYSGFTTTATETAPTAPACGSPSSEQTVTTTDALGEIISKTDGSGAAQATTAYTYDPFGELHSTKDADGNNTTINYDALGHKTSMTDPNMGNWTYTEDALGELLSQTDAKGQVIQQTFDVLGRRTSKEECTAACGSGTVTADDTWTYDTAANGIGMLASESDSISGFSRAYTYNSLSQPSEADTTISGTSTPFAVNTTYDSVGRVATVTYPASVSPGAPVASAVASPTSVVVGNNITLNGSGSTDPNGLTLYYRWSQTSGPVSASLSSATAENPTVSTSTPGMYTFQLVVSDQNGSSTPVSVSVIFYPPTPGAPTTSPNPSTTGSYTVSWSGVSAASSYELYESTDGTNYSDLGSVTGTSESFSGKTDGTYYYKVAACANSVCGAESVAASVEVTLPPATPGGVSLSPNPSGNGSYTLAWNAVPAPVSEYEVYSGGSVVASTGSTSASFSGKAQGSYSYQVVACYDTACSGASTQVTETVLYVPGAPSSISLSPNPTYVPVHGTVGNFTLSWGQASGTVTYYQVNGGVNYSASTFSASYQEQVGEYYYEVRACNTSGCGPETQTVMETVKSLGSFAMTRSSPTSPDLATPGLSQVAVASASPPASCVSLFERGAQRDANRPSSLGAACHPLIEKADGPHYVPTFKKGRCGGISGAPCAGATGTVAGVLLTLVRERQHLTANVPQQPSEAEMQAETNERADAALPTLLPPAAEKGVDAWNDWAAAYRKQHPNGPEFAPPEYIAWGDAKVEPAAGAMYRFEVQYNYDSASGALVSVSTAQTGFAYWQAATGGAAPVDAFGHLLGWTDGNNVSTVMAYDQATGAPVGISSGIGQSSAVQSLVYTWGGYGNLEERQDANQSNLYEALTYDDLNRLSTSAVSNSAGNGPGSSFNYDAMGNITTRTIAGTSQTYTYDPSHPYAVSGVTSGGSTIYSASYDADGNMTSRNGYPIQWTVDNLPSSMSSALGSSTFSYGPEGDRYSQTATFNGNTTATAYIGGLFEVVSTATDTEYRHNIVADGQIVAVHTIDQNGSAHTSYLHYDHLGSVNAITDDQGSVIQSMSFDAFGLRRDAGSWDYDLSQNQIATLKNYTDRGYTDQEELDNLSLVDLNGRVYDPTVGRMISADPTVPDALFSQAFNRFAYVYDSPLEYTDPSGFDASVPCSGTASEESEPGVIPLGKVCVTAYLIYPAGFLSFLFPGWGNGSYLPWLPNPLLPGGGGPGSHGSPKPPTKAKTPLQKSQAQLSKLKSEFCGFARNPIVQHSAISIDLGAAAIGGIDLHISLGVDSVNIFVGGGIGGGEEAGITVGPAAETNTGSIVGVRTFTTRGYGGGFGGTYTLQAGSNGVMAAGGLGAVEGALVETGGGVDFNLPSLGAVCH